ncbi:MAG TPA: hypothetical protein VGK23_05645 [Methanomassiliicoccales archaeon]|jgi:hypothetical protein
MIALRLGANHNTIKGTLRRLANKNLIVSDGTGYILPAASIERELIEKIRYDEQNDSLPRLHDLHLTFKPENIRTALGQHPELAQLFSDTDYQIEDRGPGIESYSNFNIPSYKKIPSLSSSPLSSHFLERFFNPLDPASIYQLWQPGRHCREIKGGFQEKFDLRDYAIIIQVYSTGTIKIIISNSEHAFTAREFRDSLNTIDGIFSAKTGIRFLDISDFWFIEKCHFNSDIKGDTELAGTTRLNYTVKQLDDVLFRLYEKRIGDEVYLRSETCLEKGNYPDHNLNAFMALAMGGPPANVLMASQYRAKQETDQLFEAVKGIAASQRVMVQKVDALVDNLAKKLPLVEKKDQPAIIDSELAARTQEPAPRSLTKRPTDIAGFVSAAEFSSSPQLSKSEIEQVKALSNKTVQRTLSTFEERVKKRGRS